MSNSRATVTAKSGPGITVSSAPLTGLTKFELDLSKKVLKTESSVGPREFDIAATTTLTCTISNGIATIVVSQ